MTIPAPPTPPQDSDEKATRCTHDEGEKDTAVHFDGICPICERARTDTHRALIEKLARALEWIASCNNATACYECPHKAREALQAYKEAKRT